MQTKIKKYEYDWSQLVMKVGFVLSHWIAPQDSWRTTSNPAQCKIAEVSEHPWVLGDGLIWSVRPLDVAEKILMG